MPRPFVVCPKEHKEIAKDVCRERHSGDREQGEGGRAVGLVMYSYSFVLR